MNAKNTKAAMAEEKETGDAPAAADSQARVLSEIEKQRGRWQSMAREFGGDKSEAVAFLVGLHRSFILEQTMQKPTDEELVKVADRLFRTVIEQMSKAATVELKQAELEQRERRLRLEEQTGGTGQAPAAGGMTAAEREERIREIYGR